MNKMFAHMKSLTSGGILASFLTKSALLPYLCILFVIATTFRIYPSGDDQVLLNGLSHALSCLAESPIIFPCASSHFPIFQYLIGAPFKIAKFSDQSITEVFGFVNLAWFFVAAATFWRAGLISAARPGGHLALLILLSSYMLWYMTSSFNEAGAFALFALLVASVIDKWRIGYVCLIAFACTITKEVAFPFVLYFMFLSLLARESRAEGELNLFRRIPQFIAEYKFAIAGVIAGILLNHGFNYFRFGSIANLSNLDPLFFNPWGDVPLFLSYLFFSPSGGLVFTWLSLAILLTAPALLLVRDRSTIVISTLVLLGVVAANFGLARWYSPFGWNAWGPRLSLPFLGAASMLGIYLAAPHIINFGSRFKYGAAIIFMVIATSSLPNIAARLDGGAFFARMYAPTKVALNSGIENFTVQSAPFPLYQKASAEAYARNIIVPTTVEIIFKHGGIAVLWLGSLLYLCNRFIIDSKQWEQKASRFGRAKNTLLLLSSLSLLFAAAWSTRSHRESCPHCFDLWQKFDLGQIHASYSLTPPQEALVNGLDNFPTKRSLASILIDIGRSDTLLKSISISAIGINNTDVGNWTTQPLSHLWGIGILGGKSGSALLNYGSRKDNLKLALPSELTLLIPDNGNLHKCPDIYIQIFYADGSRAETLATCKDE